MKPIHQIRFDNTPSDWSEALPMGNGHFGAMGYLDREDGLVFTFNHYDVYYRANYLPEQIASGNPYTRPAIQTPPREEMKRRALEAHADPNHPGHQNYNFCYDPKLATVWGTRREGSALAIAGSLQLSLRPGALDSAPYSTALEIEKGLFRFSARGLALRSFVARDTDVFVADVSQPRGAMIESLTLSVPITRTRPVAPYHIGSEGGDMFYIKNSYFSALKSEGKPPYEYLIAVKLVGAKGALERQDKTGALTIRLRGGAKAFQLLVTVIAPEEGPELVAAGRRKLEEAAARLTDLETAHENYWRDFFGKSGVSLPDPMLETLWHLHLYSLAACSGEGARLFGDACGLNGLWDIKGPTNWGSTWYWDVNIEQAYWPVFASNHLELARPFHKGLMAWAEVAREFAKRFHKLDGLAADYPCTFYMSTWAWCAQYFWWYYTYSQDEQFLKETAFPLFKELLQFYEGFAERDTRSGKLLMFPDVAPEQGPLTRNSMSTISCLKYLLKMGIRSGELLGGEADRVRRWKKMLDECGEYAWATSRRFGKHYKDSDWAEGLLFLVHSGILKPIYPLREMTKRSPSRVRKMAMGTLRYADALQTYGTHNMWPAAAAAVMGMGDEAARMLYDRGISFLMSANGMFSEETDRWLQDCLINCHPAYNPPLIEGGSTVVATINEMLLQSYDGLIEVFPAIPIGAPTVRYQEDRINPRHLAPAPVKKWEEASFENLLAEGAFEVSAWLRDARTAAVRVKSLKGGPIRLVNPFAGRRGVTVRCNGTKIALRRNGRILSWATRPGETYDISAGKAIPKAKARAASSPLVATALTRRRVFLGKDQDTEFYRALDAALLDFHAGYVPQSKLSVYKFDFTNPKRTKDYFKVVSWQWHLCGKQGGAFVPISTDSRYNSTAGRGWSGGAKLAYADRKAPDELRRDFLCSGAPADFLVDLRAGRYEIWIVCGDQKAPSATRVSVANGTSWESGALAAGRFSVGTVLLNHRRDGTATFRVSSGAPRTRWTLSAMIINRIL